MTHPIPSAAMAAGIALALAAKAAAADRLPQPRPFVRSADTMFSLWDSNRDGRLEGGEFAAGLHAAWADGGPLDANAYRRGWTDWFPRSKRPAFATLDANGDGKLSARELRAGIDAADLVGRWQGAEDGYLTRGEFVRGLTQAAGG